MQLRITSLRVVITALALATVGMAARPITAHADPLTCPSVQAAVGWFNPQIKAKLEDRFAGQEYEINNRKQVRLDGLVSLTAAGCDLEAIVAVTLKRKFLRDSHGTVKARLHVQHADLTGTILVVAFDQIRAVDVDLSPIGEVREWIFEHLMNRALPNSESLVIDLNE